MEGCPYLPLVLEESWAVIVGQEPKNATSPATGASLFVKRTILVDFLVLSETDSVEKNAGHLHTLI